MKNDKKKCLKPEKLIGKPEDCSSAQIEECHGNEKEHSCERETSKGSKKTK